MKIYMSQSKNKNNQHLIQNIKFKSLLDEDFKERKLKENEIIKPQLPKLQKFCGSDARRRWKG